MSLIINHNNSALQAHRNVGLSSNSLTKSIEKLSSGYKINVGADDPSGLIISEQLRSQISGLERAVQNTSEAYNLIGIAEGALNEMNSILKKMRALAIHASSNGVTSPEQVAADQAEMDSGIDTLNRIANTTKYSDQFLLNGGKQLVYDNHTMIDETTDHQMLDTEMTRVDSIFKRDGIAISIGFGGDETAHQANTKVSAKRAYIEADNAHQLCQIDGNKLTADQEFTITGTAGSRMFNFTKGENIGQIVKGINNSKDSTGVGASLIFASDVRIDNTAHANTAISPATPYAKGQAQIYGADLNTSRPKIAANGFSITDGVADAFRVGYNTDGDGKIYAKVVDVASGTVEYYKDKNCTMLIGMGDDERFSPANNSGLPGSPLNANEGIFLNINRNNAKNLDVFEIALVGQNMDNEKDMHVQGLDGYMDVGNAVMSGVNLGVNTSAEGKLFFKYTPVTFDAAGEAASFKMEVYTDQSFEPKYLVAQSATVTVADMVWDVAGDKNISPLRIESVLMDNGEDSGLNMTINVLGDDGPPILPPKTGQGGSLEFTNLGVRLYSMDYGSAETIRMQNNKGELFYQYRSDNEMEKLMIEGDTTMQVAGADARITVNGSPIYTTGLIAKATTQDFSGDLVFNQGELGLNTIAVNGYDVGKLFSKATALQGVEEKETTIQSQRRTFSPPAGYVDEVYFDMSSLDALAEQQLVVGTPLTIQVMQPPGPPNTGAQISFDGGGTSITIDYEDMLKGFQLTTPDNMKGVFVKYAPGKNEGTADATIAVSEGDLLTEMNTYATQPRGSTQEEMGNFKGGMQFQLGNTEGDQDRTIYSIQSMAMSNLGRIEWAGEEYSLQSVLGGGEACLSKDPVLAMRILSQAVNDVSSLRARLGAFQANMLQTNINSLNVAVENITKTESAIRDTDMADESTQFTRFQIMQQAGTSMLAQANQVNQNVLSLLQ